jgi:hypothetical protein
MMEEATIERLRIAVKILNSPFDHNEKVTEAEIETLKSYLGGDLTNLAVEDIAAAVIRRELKLESKGEVPKAGARIKHSAPTAE